MTTVRQLIEGSLRLIEEVGEGQSMTAQQGADGLFALIAMLDSWSIQPGMIFTETQEDLTLTANDGEYTIGTGGDLNTTRPSKIMNASIVSGNLIYPLELFSREQWASLGDLSISRIPEALYFDGNYPLATVRLYPKPSAAYTLRLFSQKPLTNFSALADSIAMPAGYERAMRYNLAVEFAPEFGKTASSTVKDIAFESKNAIESQNQYNDKNNMAVDAGLMSAGAFNILTGKS